MRERKQFTKEFKEGAVRLVTEQRRSTSDAAQSLGISPATLSRWLKAAWTQGPDAFRGHGQRPALEPENFELRQRVKHLEGQGNPPYFARFFVLTLGSAPTAPAFFQTSGADARFVEMLVDLPSGELLINQPPKDHPDDFGFGFVDEESARTMIGAWNVSVTVGCFAHPDLSLTGAMQTTTAAACSNQGAFVLSKDAGHFPKHPFRR